MNDERNDESLTPSIRARELRAKCPFCDSITQSGRQDYKFYINNETGLYTCFHCGIKGKDLPDSILGTLDVIDEIVKKPFDKSSIAKLTANKEVITSFAKNRSLEAQVNSLFYSPEKQAIALITRNRDGEAIGIKYRLLDPNAKPRYISETGSINEGSWFEGSDNTKLLIVEGELDALAGREAGFKGFILATQTNRLNESAIKHVKAFKHVFLIADNDLGGEALKNSIESLLGPNKAIIVELPKHVKDLNEFLIKNGKETVKSFVNEWLRSSLEKDTRVISSSIDEMIEFLSNTRNTKGDTTGYGSIDRLLGGGLRPNEMTVVNSFAKTGKTSFMNNIAHNLAKTEKKIALASFEMDPGRTLYPSLLSIASQTNIRALAGDDELESKMVLSESIKLILSDCSYLSNIVTLKRFGYTPWHEVEEWATMMKTQHNIEYLILDHAGFMVENMTDAEENQQLAKNIKKLTNTLQMHILVIVQAPKTKDGLSIQTSYGGMAWAQNADNFFILERSKENEMQLKVKLEASRYPGANAGSEPALLMYNREDCSLIE